MSMAPKPGSIDPMADLDLAGLLRSLWRGRWVILMSTVLAMLAGGAYAFLARQWYRAEVLLAPTQSRSLPSGLAQLGGLASLAGISLPTGGASETPVAVLRSRDFARSFIEERELLHVLLADKWDAANGRWKQADPKRQPDLRDAIKFFDEKVRLVSDDRKSGLVTLSITWTNAAQAAEWANDLAARINARLRAQALEESDRNIEYLKKELADASVVGLQQSLSKLLESEMQKSLLARGSEEYAFKVIDRAWEPRKRVKPLRGIIVGASGIGGMFLGAILAVLVGLRRSRDGSPPR